MVRRPVGNQLFWLLPITLMLVPLLAGWWTTSGCDATAMATAHADPPPQSPLPSPATVSKLDPVTVPTPDPAHAQVTCSAGHEFGWTAALSAFLLLAAAMVISSLFTEIIVQRVVAAEPATHPSAAEHNRTRRPENPTNPTSPAPASAVAVRRRALAVHVESARTDPELRSLLDERQGQGIARTHIDESGGYAEFGGLVVWVNPAEGPGAFAAPGDAVVASALGRPRNRPQSLEMGYGQ